MKFFYWIIFFVVAFETAGQAPVITSVQPLDAGPTQTIVINGNGFSSTSSQLSVWFDQVKGTIVTSTPFSIQVQVPAQAHYANVEVINLSNNLSAKSQVKFLPSYGGQSFDGTKVSTPVSSYSATDQFEFFDVATSDLDLDGKPDIVSSRAGLVSSISVTGIYLFKNSSTGIGNINFTQSSLNLTGSNPGSTTEIICDDLNGDGKPDIIASRGGTNRNEVFIQKNTNSVVGTLSFAAATSLVLPPPDPSNPTLNVPLSFKVASRDLNGDGNPEIIVANSFANSNASVYNRIFVFQNTSSGGSLTFNPTPIQLTVTGASTTYGVEVQDVDGDTLPDIILNQFFSSDIYIFRNTSSGNISFAPVTDIPALGSFTLVTSGDLNNDGKLDIVATAQNDNDLRYWLNSSTPGNISFSSTDTLHTDSGPFGVDLNDVDGDGDVDIVVANKGGSNLNVFRQDQSSPLTFTKVKIATPNYTSRSIKSADFDGDGKPDFVYTATPSSGQFALFVLRNGNCWNPVITSSTESPSPAPICTTQTIRIQSQPALGANYVWKNGATTVQSGALNYFDVVGSANAGTYTVTVNGTVDTGCSVQSNGFTLSSSTGTAPANPTIGNNVPCLGSSLNLTTPTVTGATYSWSGPNGFSSASQNPTITPVVNANAGIYSLQVTVGSCESNVTTKQLDVAAVPILPVTASPSAIACAGSSINLSVSGSGYTYQWNKGGVAISGQTGATLSLTSLSSSAEGDYSVVVTSLSSTCSQETAKTSVMVFAAPSANFSISSPDCQGSSITFTDQTSGADSRGTLTYSWSFGDGSPVSTLQSPTHVYSTTAGFSPNLTVGYQQIPSGCTSNVTKPLTINAPVQPIIQASANPICSGDQTSLSITGSYNSITWVGVTGSTSSVNITKPGKYKVNTTDANSCTAIDSITITSKPLIPLTLSKDTAINLGGQAKLVASGADTYVWTPNGKTLSDSTIANPIASPLVTTIYTVHAQKTGYCDSIRTVKVTVETGGANIKPPKIFSPNGDGCNDAWKLCQSSTPCVPGACPEETIYNEWTMTIYDGHGSLVYQQKGFVSWDGNNNGQKAPDGTYFYVFSGASSGKPSTPSTGSILLVR